MVLVAAPAAAALLRVLATLHHVRAPLPTPPRCPWPCAPCARTTQTRELLECILSLREGNKADGRSIWQTIVSLRPFTLQHRSEVGALAITALQGRG